MEYDGHTHIESKYDIESLEVGIGLNEVDDLKPSDYFYKAVNQSKTYYELEEKLQKHYTTQDLSNPSIKNMMECDIVSQRIAQLINTNAFTFSHLTLATIHRKLFKGLFSRDLAGFVGKFRTYNISKREPILNGDSVVYADSEDIEQNLALIFRQYKQEIFTQSNQANIINNAAEFISNIWQIHPFVEGNTRTTAVFTIKMLQSIGFQVNNDIFKDNSKYFRNALVLDSYANPLQGIGFDSSYLHSFLAKMLFDKNLPLKHIPKNIYEQNTIKIDNADIPKLPKNIQISIKKPHKR